MDRARNALKVLGHAVHVRDLLKHMGEEASKANRASLSGSMGAYVRKGLIFTKPAPNTFGLIEFDEGQDLPPEPPSGFGGDDGEPSVPPAPTQPQAKRRSAPAGVTPE